MATYAVLGATGNCGTALIHNVLRTEHSKINAYCRSRNKLIHALPQVSDSKRVKVFEGNIYNIDLLAECVRGTKAIFHVVSTNVNVPGYNIGLETAESIISALKKIRESEPDSKMPRIVLLSSSTIEKHLSRHMAWWFRSILETSAAYVYDDLRRTEAFLRGHQDWVSTIFIKPGGLSLDVQRGHQLNLDHDESFVSYLDLAAAMIEAADDAQGRFDMKNVSVVNTNGSARFPRGTPMCILTGLARYYFPFLHKYLPAAGPS